ncbi:CC0125/CC1285 family lipoprotein [Colwellia psychrerythraea]|uniref:Lipoprotein n=1 Tax=Colwellia psychrerythraea TaxID=28229 RepID=A0A099KK13_COLPS|nr:hypothetical protein [Colwellia psychrerythraea]KGJ90746.1 hypothetical protein GAB14E_3552 [Colwellia psychrerythraea]
MQRRSLIVCVLLALCTGCSAVSYQSAGLRGGYSERLLSEHSYRVRYSGNGSVTLEQAIDFVMLRGAILAKNNGAKVFTSSDFKTKVSKVDLGTPGVYAYKPMVYVTVSLASEYDPKRMASCARFSLIFQLSEAAKKTVEHAHTTDSCIEEIRKKYKLTDQQIADKKL